MVFYYLDYVDEVCNNKHYGLMFENKNTCLEYFTKHNINFYHQCLYELPFDDISTDKPASINIIIYGQGYDEPIIKILDKNIDIIELIKKCENDMINTPYIKYINAEIIINEETYKNKCIKTNIEYRLLNDSYLSEDDYIQLCDSGITILRNITIIN